MSRDGSHLKAIAIISSTAVALLATLVRSQLDRESRAVVVLASKAGPKSQALEAALRGLERRADRRMCASGFCIETCTVSSGVAEQPCGHEETKRGARNRLTAARALFARERCDYVVAIENGIVHHSNDDWYDIAWVLVEDCSSRRVAAVMSTALKFPQQYVEQARDAPGVRVKHILSHSHLRK